MHTVWGSRGRGSPTVLWCGQCWTLQSLAWAGPSMRAGDQVSPAHTPTARDRLPPTHPAQVGGLPTAPARTQPCFCRNTAKPRFVCCTSVFI